MANMQLSSSTALAVRDPWALVPSLGNLDAYISAVNRLPMLSAEEETRLARRLRDQQDLDAAGRLVLSHLRLVVSVARQYLGYGLPQGDLIQEGNVGLMKAVRRFDPNQGVRLVSYALHWIKAEIHEYILKNWRLVKVATTKAQRKLFFNLRSMKRQMKGEAADGATHRAGLTEAEIDRVAAELNVRREDVIEMETRFAGGDVALEPGGDDDDESFAPIAYLADDRQEPTRAIEARRRDEADPPAGGQDLREAADVEAALEPVERGQPWRVRGRQMRVGVVLDDMEVVRLRQLQQLMRAGQRQHAAGRVVQHRDGHVQAGAVLARQRLHHRQVGPVGPARHRQQPHAQQRQPRVFDRPAGLVDQHRVARRQQRARDQIERLGRAQRGHDLARRGAHADIGQTLRQRLAQPRVARRLAVVQRGGAQLVLAAAGQHPAQRGLQHRRIQPGGRQGAQARAGPAAAAEYAADQRAGVDWHPRAVGR